MTTTLRFPVRMIEALALAAHERAFAERGDRYATVEEMEMHRADPLACDDMVMPAIRAALDITGEFDRSCRVRRDGEEVIEFVNHWDDADTSAPAFVGTVFRSFEAPDNAEAIEAAKAEIRAQFPNAVETLYESEGCPLTNSEIVIWAREVRLAGMNAAAGKTCVCTINYAIHPDGYWEQVGLSASTPWA
jgi:hypothetical protein